MKKGEQKRVLTPKKNKKRNTFITLLWPERKSGLFSTPTPEEEARSSSIICRTCSRMHAKTLAAKKLVIFVDHAPCHKTPNVKRFVRQES
jgi:hypothetical protein